MSIAWFIFMTFVIVGLQIFIYSQFGLKQVEYERSFSETVVFTGEKVEMVDEISNRKFLPLPWLRLESRLHKDLQFDRKIESAADELQLHKSMFSFLPYQKIRRTHTFTCTKRGYYQFSDVHMTTGDVFGFEEAFKQIKAYGEIIVYPRLLEMEELPLPTQHWLGEVVVRRWIVEDPFLAVGVREYASGDPLQAVNWKATARTNQLQVTKKDYSADHHLMIYVNFNQTGDVWLPILDEAWIEEALSYAATIAEHAIRKGVPTGFACNSYVSKRDADRIRIEPENSSHHLAYLFETIAKLAVDANRSIQSFLQRDVEDRVSGTDILLITAIRTTEMNNMIKQLERQGNMVHVIVLESDIVNEHLIAGGR